MDVKYADVTQLLLTHRHVSIMTYVMCVWITLTLKSKIGDVHNLEKHKSHIFGARCVEK